MCSRVFGDTKVWGCPGSKKEEASSSSPSSSSRGRAKLRKLELSNSMHPQYIAFQILLALNKSVYNGISCHGLNFLVEDHGGDEDENKTRHAEETSAMYINHLKVLIHSRKWLSLEFHRCLGVESLFWMPAILDSDIDSNKGSNAATTPSKNSSSHLMANTTEVDFLLLKFPRTSILNVDSYNANRHRNFFANLWDHWKVRELSLSMDFCPGWTREFCHSKSSLLEGLELQPDCTWHKRQTTAAEKLGDDDNVNSEQKDKISETDTPHSINCWEFFCQELRINHPHLRELDIRFKILDADLAYLVNSAIAPVVTDSDFPATSPILTIEKLHFGKWCCCGDESLLALSRFLASPSGQHVKSLTMSRGTKLPSRAALEAGYRPQHTNDEDGRGLLAFCRALKHSTSLAKLDLGDYVLDEHVLSAMFESLVTASAPIERLSLFHCATTSPDVYDRVLTGSSSGIDSEQDPKGNSSLPCLIQNRLPLLRMLFLSKGAEKALCKVLKSNTSITSISNHRRTKTHEYYLDLNRGGRRILTASSSALSPALWPRILERAGSGEDIYLGKDRKHDVVHCLLRNRILLEL